VALSPDGKRAASASDWLAVIWGTDTGRAIWSIDAREGEGALGWSFGWPDTFAFSADGRWIAVSGGLAVGVWNASPEARQDPPPNATLAARGVVAMEFSPTDGRLLLAAGWGLAACGTPRPGT
jgi:hypothetical protein